ncbi:MAG: DUF5696 domain-containing protein [Roseburia sp.]
MEKRKNLLAVLLAGILICQSSAEIVKAEPNGEKQNDYETAALADMKLIAENESLELYFDEIETDIAVREKKSGEVWFSNPPDMEQDSFSTSYYQKVLKSQINLTYINESTQVSTMNNYAEAVEEGQFETETIENGVRITYTIGEGTAFLLLPEAISEERMTTFLEKMDKSQQKKINRNYTLYDIAEVEEDKKKDLLEKYPLLETEKLYVLRGGVKDYLKEELAEYFAEAGYTESDYEQDAQNIGVKEEDDNAWFQIPITYELDGENLVVTINPEEVVYNDNGYYLVGIDMLRYFGASMSEDGYLFVPDGSGALIHFNNGKTTAASYGAQVYGQDETMLYTTYYESQIDAANTVKMPVFGIKENEKALFAVVEGGDAYATINAEIAGKTTGYNNVYAGFSYLQYGSASLDDMVGANSYYMYSEAEFEGDYSIRYSFLTEEDADYSGMAACYRAYLKAQGVLAKEEQPTELPFFAEYIGAIDKSKTIFGVKYSSVETLTTYQQAEAITEELKEGGIENLNIVYSGWMNGGLHGTAATKFSPVSKLEEGNIKLSEFLMDMEDAGNKLFMTLDLQYVYEDELFDGYSAMHYAPRYFDNTNIKVNEYGLASRVSEGTLANLISPYYVNQITEALSGKLSKKKIGGVNVGTLSWELYSDLLEEKYTDRQMAEKNNVAAIETLSRDGFSLLCDNANAYAWGAADAIINVPLCSNNYMIIDEEIPFYEMVLHGYIAYAGEALNLADDYTTTLLKSVESGAGLNFKWIYAPNSVLKETEYDSLYSVNYEAWLAQAVVDYQRINEQLGYLQGEEMISHENITKDTAKVCYGDGSIVYVNYGSDAVTVDGISIGAKDFMVKKGAE